MRKTLAALCGFFIACGIAQAQNSSGTQTLTVANAACVSGSCVLLKFDSNDVASATISLSGTFNATVVFESSNDGLALTDSNKVWVAIAGTPLNGTTAVTSATTANTWKFNVASSTDIRARCSVFTSAPTVIIKSSRAVANAIGGGGGAVFASGGTTNNVIPKSNGSSQLADSGITDNATTISTSELWNTSSNGAVTAASYQVGAANNGIFGSGGTDVRIAANGNTGLIVQANLAYLNNALAFTSANDLQLARVGSRSLLLGVPASATPSANTFQIGENSRGGTDSNVAGATGTLQAGIGTGTGAGSKLAISRNLMGASGSTAQTQSNAFAVGQSKTLSNTSATAQAIATITLGSNAGGGASGIFTLVCTDGTNFDSETQSFNVSYVNKAGAVTVGTPAITTSTAANNSGSCTLGITAVANGNNIDLKVTPVFGTIVPTTVTLYPIITHSTNTVTFN